MEKTITEKERAYIREIVREVIAELPCEKHAKRLGKIEIKVFNGFTLKINILYGLYVVIIGLLVRIAFF